MPKATLIVRLAGHKQAYSMDAEARERRTQDHPTKSAVLGIIAASFGKPRHEDGKYPTYADLAKLEMMVRIDQPGMVEKEFVTGGSGKDWRYNPHTGKAFVIERGNPLGITKASADGPPIYDPDPDSESADWESQFMRPNDGKRTTRYKYHLVNAAFTVALYGDRDLLEKIVMAMHAPVFPPFLGRRAFPPMLPLLGPDCLMDASLREALAKTPSIAEIKSRLGGRPYHPQKLRAIVECLPTDEGARMVRDVPPSFDVRPFEPRFVKDEWVDPPIRLPNPQAEKVEEPSQPPKRQVARGDLGTFLTRIEVKPDLLETLRKDVVKAHAFVFDCFDKQDAIKTESGRVQFHIGKSAIFVRSPNKPNEDRLKSRTDIKSWSMDRENYPLSGAVTFALKFNAAKVVTTPEGSSRTKVIAMNVPETRDFVAAALTGNGAKVLKITVRDDGFYRADHQRSKVSLKSLLVEGELEIEDHESFAGLLRNGLGRAKAWGFGMPRVGR